MPTPADLIAALTLAIDHFVSGVVVAGTAAKIDQRPAADLIKTLTQADAANTAAIAAIATAQATDPAPAHDAWSASVAAAVTVMQRAQRAANAAPSGFATDGVRAATSAYQALVAIEPPATVLAAVAAATAKQATTQAALDAQMLQATQYLNYLAVS